MATSGAADPDLHNLPELPRSRVLAPDGQVFTWGPIQRIHMIGRYEIVEYRQDCRLLHPVEARVAHGRTMFHVYIDRKSASRGYLTLDEALIGAVALANDGVNTRADVYFARMVGLGNKEDAGG